MSVKTELDDSWTSWLAASLYNTWKNANPAENVKLLAYRAGTTGRPALVTKFGQALVAETAAWLLSGGSAPPPPPSTAGGACYIKLGPGELPASHTNDFALLIVSQGGIAAAVATGRPACFYTSPQVPPAGQGSYAIPYAQAASNNWLLRDTGGNLMVTSFGNYILDYGILAARVAFADAIVGLMNGWGADGVFHDDIQGHWTGFQGDFNTKTPRTAGGAAYTNATWEAAAADWCHYVGDRVKSLGKLMIFNATKFISGDGSSDTGVMVKNFWTLIGGACCTHLCREYFEYTPNGTKRLVGPAGDQNWDGWQALVAHTHSLGCNFLGIEAQGNAGVAYGRAAALLDYSGGDLFARDGGGNDQWSDTWAHDMGTPTSAKQLVGSEWRRVFANGTVLTNPTTGTVTIP